MLGRGLEECTVDEAGLRLVLNWVQHAVIIAYEYNCNLRLVTRTKNSLMLTARLEPLRRGKRRLFNKVLRDQTHESSGIN